MSIPPLPTDLEQLGRRKFSFYPAILGVEQNEWIFGRANWSEIQVINTHSGAEVWIPRRFVGEIARVDDPVTIVGLRGELEFREGAVWPHRRRVIEMPVAVNGGAVDGEPVRPGRSGTPHLAPVVNIRLEPTGDSKAGRTAGVILLLSAVACSVVLGVVRNSSRVRARTQEYAQADLSYLRLRPGDDLNAIKAKLGPPSMTHAFAGTAGTHLWGLEYPNFRFTVLLSGPAEAEATYTGTLDAAKRLVSGSFAPSQGRPSGTLPNSGQF